MQFYVSNSSTSNTLYIDKFFKKLQIFVKKRDTYKFHIYFYFKQRMY